MVLEARNFIAHEVRRDRAVVVGVFSQRHIDGDDIVGRAICDDPLQRLFDVPASCEAGIVEYLEGNDVAAGSHARVRGILRADDAGHVGTVPDDVARIRIVAAGEVVRIDDAVGDAVVVGVRSEERVLEIDAGIDDDDGLAATVDAGEAGIGAELIQADQRRVRLGKRLYDGVAAVRRCARCRREGRGG
jgi:hypothetical protein